MSFRGRLLALIVAVSMVQAGVAAYTFFDLQSEPAKQRVQAQLNAALRGVAPVLDTELDRAGSDLVTLLEDPALQPAIESGDWAAVDQLLDASTSTDATGDDAASEPTDGFTQPEAGDAHAATAYVTDATGEIVAGTRPPGALIEQPGTTSSRLLRGAKLIATVHVPVVVDRSFLDARVARYVPKGVDVFVADEQELMSSAKEATVAVSRPKALREGLHELELNGDRQLVLAQPLLDGSILVGASIPAKVAAKQQHEGLSALWGFVALLVTIMVVVAFVVSRAVADALRKFAESARELAGGRLDRRIPVVGDDEVATLASSFNEMAENLEDRIERLVEARQSMRRQVELFGDALANATEMEEMLQAVCSLAIESTPATHARFWTLDEDGHFEHAACIGLRPGDTDPCGLEKAVTVRNSSVLGGEGIPQWLVVPARRGDGQIVGLLTLVTTSEAFADDDVRIAERIAIQAAVAIDNARMHEQLRLQATRDGLTGLPNHRSLQDELTRRLAEAYEADMPLGICMLDIDNFKRVNDTYGHPIGDEAIKAIGKTLAHGIGGMGMVGRYGGEEFVVIMPGCDADAAMRIADRLREDITRIEVPLEDGGILKVTSSFGVANVDQQHPGERVENAELLHQADLAMYNSKRSGKNCVSLGGPDVVAIEMSDAEKAKLEARERGDVAAEQAAAASLETNVAVVEPVAEPADDFYDPFDFAA